MHLIVFYMVQRETQARERAQRMVGAQQAWLARDLQLADRSAAVEARPQAGKLTFKRLVSAMGFAQR